MALSFTRRQGVDWRVRCLVSCQGTIGAERLDKIFQTTEVLRDGGAATGTYPAMAAGNHVLSGA